MQELLLIEKLIKASKQIVNNVRASILAKADYEQTVTMVNGILLGLLIDIGTEGAKEKDFTRSFRYFANGCKCWFLRRQKFCSVLIIKQMRK